MKDIDSNMSPLAPNGKVRQNIEGDVFVEFTYTAEKLAVTLISESKGSTTFQLTEETTDLLKAMLFCLDISLQKAREQQSRKSLNRSLWDEAVRQAGVHRWKAQEIYNRLKAEQKEINKELACTGARERKNKK